MSKIESVLKVLSLCVYIFSFPEYSLNFLRRIRNNAHPKHVHTKETISKDNVLISLLLNPCFEIESRNIFDQIDNQNHEIVN